MQAVRPGDALRVLTVDAFAPWLEYALDAFGVDRCLFASNFPVDSMYGTFDELYTVFSTVTAASTVHPGEALR